jgi:FkbM family methyltransferase
MSYQDLLKYRNQEVDGVSGWTWVNSDDGAWDGPHREWEETHRDAYLSVSRERNVVVQAGGNCGLYPRLFAKYFKTVYTFEPDPLNFHCLVNNCQMDNIIKINGALGDDNRMVRVERMAMNNVGCHKVTGKDGERLVPQFTIDQLYLPACDLIQLDVEGYEINILRGAVKTIEKYKPGISCECGNNNGIPEFLARYGYKIITTVGSDVIYSAQ